jgi:hypothetical protein
MKGRWFVEGAGVAILLLAKYIWPVLSLYHLFVYHDPVSVSTVAAGFAIDLASTCVLFAAVLALLDYYSPQESGLVWVAFLALWVTTAVDFAVFLLDFYHAELSWTLTLRVGLLCGALGAGILPSFFSPRVLTKCVKGARVGLAILGCCIFWMLPQLVYTAVRTHTPATEAFNRTVQQPSSSSQRVVWVLLDELSYDQVFDHRQPSVQLPYLDQLKNQSVVFSDVHPEGYYTERILPALFLGRRIDNIRSSLRRDLYVHDVAASRWEPFHQQSSIFAEAKRSGWTTGIAGWYNPYCHILKNVLDSCYWQDITPFPSMAPGEEPSILKAAAFPINLLLSHLRHSGSLSDSEVQAHAQEYRDLIGAADSLIQNESIRFVFLHLPAPHPPGIYDRKTNTLGVKGTYLDNLVLADRTLGNLLDAIQKTAAASKTTLIISSDHSWRVDMWRNEPGWTKEEERASGGRFDPRPVLMIRFPGSNTGELRTERFPELAIDGIIRAMLHNELHSQSELDGWLAKNAGHGGQNLVANR